MNIYTQVCGIAILVVLLSFYNYNNQLKLNIGKAFKRMMMFSIVSLIFDIMSVIALASMDSWGESTTRFFCRIYLISLIGVLTNCLMYLYYDVYDNVKKRLNRINLTSATALSSCVLTCVLPINMHVDNVEQIYYTSGPATIATYIFAAIIMLQMAYLAFSKKISMEPDRCFCIRIWLYIWITSCCIQLVRKEILIVSFAGALGVLIVYLKLENPEMITNKKSGILNQAGLDKYVTELFNNGTQFGVIMCTYEHALSRITNPDEQRDILRELFIFFKSVPNATVFRSSDYEIIFVIEDYCNIDKVKNKIRDRFENTWGNVNKIEIAPYILTIPYAYQLKDLNELLSIVKHVVRYDKEYADKRYAVVNQDVIKNIQRNLVMEQEVKLAIEEDRIEVFCQPIFSNKEDRYTTGEALVRIRKREGGYIPPVDFIDLIENNGDIVQVGLIVFEKICRFIQKYGLKQYGIHYMEVNLSMVQCADKHLATDYLAVMRKYDIDPATINLEITESASMHSKRILLDNMETLMEHGVCFSLDDFGTGQSNLNYIAEMPVSIVKFDRSMIQGYFNDEKTRYILDAAIQMIHGLGLDIVAEGVETKEQYTELRDKGITYIQGYYFSKPVPLPEFYDIMRYNLG